MKNKLIPIVFLGIALLLSCSKSDEEVDPSPPQSYENPCRSEQSEESISILSDSSEKKK
jgi:hypothetical protein